MVKADIAREYRTKFPQTPTLTLARKVYKDNISVFKNVEDARFQLRYIEGKTGKANIKYVKSSEFYQEQERPRNPFNLPDSEETIFEPFVIKNHSRILILSDIHFPYHSISALNAALTYAKKEVIDGVVLNGDTLDFYQLSRFEKDPRKRSFAHELDAGKKFLEILQKEFECKVYWKNGNHEDRYENYLKVKAPELLGVSDFKIDQLLKFRDYNTTLIENKRIIKANKLNIIHGHEYPCGSFNPVNIARGLFLKGKVSAIQGHNHQTSEHTESNMNEEIITTWSIGCLSELHPMYMPLNKWNHGFAIVDLNDNKKDFEVKNKRIFNGKVL